MLRIVTAFCLFPFITMSASLTTLSGRCLCYSISWKLPDVHVGQVLVCHCSECRRVSGSTSIPFAALPRQPLLAQLQEDAPNLAKIALSDVAARYFCRNCSSIMYMDYNAPNTVWVPIGTLDDFDPQLIQVPRDSQIFGESKMAATDTLCQLPLQQNFGTYKPDVCSGISFDQLPSWQDEEAAAAKQKEKEES
jgi:hypothetical protein